MTIDPVERALPGFLAHSRWFAGKEKPLRSARILDVLRLSVDPSFGCLTIVGVEGSDGRAERYLLPLACAWGRKASELRRRRADTVLAEIPRGRGGSAGIMFDAFNDKAFTRALLNAFAQRKRLHGQTGVAKAITTRVFRQWHAARPGKRREPASGSQSNSTAVVGERVFLKLYRRLTEGVHPEIEIGRYLSEHAKFRHVAPALGVLEYVNGSGAPTSLAFLQGFVRSDGDAWTYTLESLEEFLRQARGTPVREIPRRAAEFLRAIRLLGRRTAELHHALSLGQGRDAFAPESFSAKDQRELVNSMRALTRSVFRKLRSSLGRVPPRLRSDARRVLKIENRVDKLAGDILRMRISAPRIRCHGDLHLRQVLRSDGDYIITDFEGEPGRSVQDRRVKQCALRDVASMLRSFDYAAESVLIRFPSKEKWVDAWRHWAYAAFLEGYIEVAQGGRFFPKDAVESSRLLQFYLLEKAVYELGGELGYRPDWLGAPLRGILRLVDERERNGRARQ